MGRRAHVLTLALLLLGACVKARLAEDGGLPTDAGSCGAGSLDAGSLDAGSLDAGSLDAGSDAAPVPELPVLWQDDFEDGALDGWTIGNIDCTSWNESRGALRSGPGQTCASWNDPRCSGEGPALIHRTDPFDVGDGTFTIEVAVNATVVGPGRERMGIGLANDAPGVWTGTRVDQDRLISVFVEAGFLVVQRGRQGIGESIGRIDAAVRLGTWFRLRLGACGAAGYHLTLHDAGGTLVAMHDAPETDVTPPAGTRQVFVQLFSEGSGKLFDDLVIRRGCAR